MAEPNLRTTIVGDLISELDLLRDPANRDGPFESQSSCSLPRFSQEAACKDFGARRDLTGISQFCKGNGSDGHPKLQEEFNEFRCDLGIESQVVDSCPLLERLRRRSVCQKQENCAKLWNNLELRKALNNLSGASQNPSLAVRERPFSNRLDLLEADLEADRLHHKNCDVHSGQSPFTRVCQRDRAKMMRCGRYDQLGCLGSIKPVQRSHSTPSRSKETPRSSQVSTPSTPRQCISPRSCVPRSPCRKSQPCVSSPVRHSQALLRAEKHGRQKGGALCSPRASKDCGCPSEASRAKLQRPALLRPPSCSPRHGGHQANQSCTDSTADDSNAHFFNLGEPVTFGPVAKVRLSKKIATPQFGRVNFLQDL